ncbi:hypothetical protein FNU76_22010 [Chitinimonas arctica]|uniref:Uncharacterized protein n=1 Tax=Chitinimonas arctica TaxID=2594795 RepID=A0A516SKX7_9NEIS|nr:hypothetical protein [Chitinimonas arctica]QDQ28810.1 hypothetical protein FNU76_22010 [Chitinimonas arctica]
MGLPAITAAFRRTFTNFATSEAGHKKVAMSSTQRDIKRNTRDCVFFYSWSILSGVSAAVSAVVAIFNGDAAPALNMASDVVLTIAKGVMAAGESAASNHELAGGIEKRLDIRKQKEQDRDGMNRHLRGCVHKMADMRTFSEKTNDCAAFLRHDKARIDEIRQNKTLLSKGLGFGRDGLLQLGSVGTRAAVVAETINTAVNVSVPAASLGGAIFGFISAILQVGQGIAEYCNALKELAIVDRHCARISHCQDAGNLPILSTFQSAKDVERVKDDHMSPAPGILDGQVGTDSTRSTHLDKYLKTLEATERESAAEFKQIEKMYEFMFSHFKANHLKERKVQEALKSNAVIRIIYGGICVVLAGVGLGLTATGAGASIGLPIIAGGGGALGVAWLARAGKNAWRERKELQEASELDNALRAEADTLLKPTPSLAELEASILINANYQKNPYIMVAVIAHHLGGGKYVAEKEGISKDEVATKLVGEVSYISKAGLKMRREVASRFLAETGMSSDGIRAVKGVLATGASEMVALGIERMQQFILGDTGRVLGLLRR